MLLVDKPRKFFERTKPASLLLQLLRNASPVIYSVFSLLVHFTDWDDDFASRH